MFRPFIFLLIFTSCVSAGQLALSVDGAATYALKHNSALHAARFRIEEARGRLQRSGLLTNPELEIEFTRLTPGPEGALSVTLLQRFPLTARLRHERAVSRAELAAAEAEVRASERQTAAEVRALAVRMLAARGQRELRARQQENSRELTSFLRKRIEAGEASGVDAAQVELDTQQLELEALQLAAAELELGRALRALLGVAGEVIITGQLAPPAPPRAPGESGERPDVQAAEHRAEAARAAALQQRASRWEDFGVGAIYGADRELDDPGPVETRQLFGIKVSVPLPLWNSNAGRIREAEAAAARTAQEAKTVRFTAGNDVAGARREMAALGKIVTALDTQLLPKTAEIEERLRQQYAAGQLPLTDVLRARIRRLELQRTRLDALRDYHLARIRHEAGASVADRSTPSSLP